MNTASSDYSGNRFELLVQSVTDYAIFMLDLGGQIVSWNAGARRFKGYEAEEIIGEHFSRFYTPQDQAAGIPALALATAEQEGRFEAEGWRVRKDGTHFWANVVIDPIRDPSGQLIGFAKVTRDLTDRRAAQEALRKSEERFRMLVESVTDYAIYMLDPVGTITSWNSGAQFDLSFPIVPRLKASTSANLFNERTPIDTTDGRGTQRTFRYSTNATFEWNGKDRGSVPGDVA